MKATLLLSKISNPTWTIDTINLLLNKLCVLPGTLDTWERDDYLYYAGIRIDVDFPYKKETIRIFKGYVESIANDGIRRFIDINRELEMFVFQNSRDKIEDEIYNQILISEFLVVRLL
jgi:hypothetical protein